MPGTVSFSCIIEWMKTNNLISKVLCSKSLEEVEAKKVAFVYHFKIKDADIYKEWLKESSHNFGCKRLFQIRPDPVPREGMRLDELVIDEFSSVQEAFDFNAAFEDIFQYFCSEYAVLAIKPEPSRTFLTVKGISWLIRLYKGYNDPAVSTTWQNKNSSIWPDEEQMKVARFQNSDEPLFVYNLNKYKSVADYNGILKDSPKLTGKEAYDRYSKMVSFELLRRGAYPVYGGKPVCLFGKSDTCVLADDWDHFILVRYPQRRNLFSLLESEDFQNGMVHREAGLSRAVVLMGKELVKYGEYKV